MSVKPSRTVNTSAPVWLYVGAVPLVVGAVLAGVGEAAAAICLFLVGGVWCVVGFTLFVRRIKRLRERERLTTRDVVELEYTPWMRRAAAGYGWVVSLSIGVGFLVAVVVVVIAVIAR